MLQFTAVWKAACSYSGRYNRVKLYVLLIDLTHTQIYNKNCIPLLFMMSFLLKMPVLHVITLQKFIWKLAELIILGLSNMKHFQS